MIGGLIVLTLLLLSLVAMLVLNQQYDLYQVTAAAMQQKNTDKYAENIQAIIPGMATAPGVASPSCGGGSCVAYNITLNNPGIGVQIVAIYINSTQQPGCTTPCILGPSQSNNPAPFTFAKSESHINSGEFVHGIVFWLPWTSGCSPSPTSCVTLPPTCTVAGAQINYNCNTITLITSRGRSFSFQWPFPPQGPSSGTGAGGGGTGIYIGPLVYTFKRALVAYTNSSSCNPNCTPQIPIGGNNGYWIIPSGKLIIYVQLQTDVGVQHDVYLTPQSVLELEVYTSPGQAPAHGFIIAPITPTFCGKFAVNCNATYGYYANGNTGNPSSIVPYQTCNPAQLPPNYGNCNTPRYLIPKPNAAQQASKQKGDPVIVAFDFTPGNGINANWPGNSVLTFLGLTYVWDDGKGSGAYVYGVTLPFVAMCIDNSNKCPG